MGYLLKEVLKTLCGVDQWSYAVFWKIGCQNPKLLILEDCYYGTITHAGAFDDWEVCLVSGEARTSLLGAQAGYRVQLLVNKMMMDNHVNVVGEGLVGQAAFTGNYQWIHSHNYSREAHPPEVLYEMRRQISAGMQTISVIPILPHGVVQLGSSSTIMENIGFVNDVRTLILQLGCVPGALFSDNSATREPAPKFGSSTGLGKSASMDSSGKSKLKDLTTCVTDNYNQQDNSPALRVVGETSNFRISQIQDNLLSTNATFPNPQCSGKSNDHGQAEMVLAMKSGLWGPQENMVRRAEVITSNSELWQKQEDSFNIRGSRMNPQSSLSSLATNNDLVSSSHNCSSSSLSHEPSDLLNVSGGNLLARSNPSSFSSVHRLANSNISPVRISEGELQNVTQYKAEVENDMFHDIIVPFPLSDDHIHLNEYIPGFVHDGQKPDNGYQNLEPKGSQFGDAYVQPQSGDDLFDVLGVNFKNKILNGSRISFPNNGPEKNSQNLDKNNCALHKLPNAGSQLQMVDDGNSDNDHLLNAVVSRVQSATKQSSEDDLSWRTNASSNKMQEGLFGVSNFLTKTGALSSCSIKSESCKEKSGKFSQTNSFYGSQISSWVDQGPDMKPSISTSTEYSKRPDESSKSNRKRVKPAENPRSRPKDRQMIQDRVKELREIVPNGAKCTIDALLERTIKHMLFLQSVTTHADKLKQMGESKIIGKDGELLLKDNFEGAATWAYEVGSQSVVCPITVEDLSPPCQMLVEMLCEEQGLFLEIVDIVRGLGLTILKGVMETRNGKIWARFAVEANRDVTRMEIFISLVHLLEQMIKDGASSASCIGNGN